MVPKKSTTGRVTPPKQDPLAVPTTASQWKKATVEGILVRVPSGNVARIITPGMDVFISNGTIPNALLPLVQASMSTRTAPSDEDLGKVLEDEDTLKAIIELANDVMVQCCLEPKVSSVPLNEHGLPLPPDHPGRDPETLYADEVNFMDKMFIFNVAVGGTQHLEKFRQESGLDVGLVSER